MYLHVCIAVGNSGEAHLQDLIVAMIFISTERAKPAV